ncbi:hypothetical protein [Streptomyces sp. 049-1]|uniref:hypothetical protein n=1 Tax=Streptomyces sp. 049-1 TaxID=2789264 RepID=UPI00397EE6E5
MTTHPVLARTVADERASYSGRGPGPTTPPAGSHAARRRGPAAPRGPVAGSPHPGGPA